MDLQILGCFVTDDIKIVIKESLSTSNHCYHTCSPILKSNSSVSQHQAQDISDGLYAH